MSTKRYYYDNPTAAIWMLQNFGMEFESPVLGRDIPLLDLIQMLAIGMTRPILVKKSSEALLEPQKDDMVDLGDHGIAFVVERKDNNIDCALFDASTGMFKSGYWHRRWVPVIKRGSVNFHWPKLGDRGELGYV